MINEETLTLYFYNDGLSESERSDIEHALQSDDLLAARYATLCGELDGLRQLDDVEAPSHLKHQWHAAIEQAARLENQKAAPQRTPFFSIAWGGAMAAALVIGVALGTLFDDDVVVVDPGNVVLTDPGIKATPAAFTRGLQAHLQDAQWELANIPQQPGDEQSILLMQIIAQNRLFERAAESNNAPDVARLMRAFEPILMRLAEHDIAPEHAEALRSQLSFELKAMLTKIQQTSSEDAQSI